MRRDAPVIWRSWIFLDAGHRRLSLCQPRSRPIQLARLKVVMVSGKSFGPTSSAPGYGRIFSLRRPYNIETFASQIAEGSGPRRDKAAQPPSSSPCRNSRPPPGPSCRSTVLGLPRPGRAQDAPFLPPTASRSTASRINPATASSSSTRQRHRALGGQLALAGPRELFLFLTHFHPDHTQGLGAFEGVRTAGYTLHISGAKDARQKPAGSGHRGVEASLPAGRGRGDVQLHELLEQTYRSRPRDALVLLRQPSGTTWASSSRPRRYRFYCPDSELYGETAPGPAGLRRPLFRASAREPISSSTSAATPPRTTGPQESDSKLHERVNLAARPGPSASCCSTPTANTPRGCSTAWASRPRAPREKGYSSEVALARET